MTEDTNVYCRKVTHWAVIRILISNLCRNGSDPWSGLIILGNPGSISLHTHGLPRMILNHGFDLFRQPRRYIHNVKVMVHSCTSFGIIFILQYFDCAYTFGYLYSELRYHYIFYYSVEIIDQRLRN